MSCGVKGGDIDHGGGDILNVESHRKKEEETNEYRIPRMYPTGT